MVSAWKTISANPEIWNGCFLTWRGSWLYRNLESRIFRIGCCSICSLVLVILGIIFPLPIMQAFVSVAILSGVCFLHLPFTSLYIVCPSVISTAVAWVDDEFIPLGMSCFRVFVDWGKHFVICYAVASFFFFFSLIGTTLSWEQALLKICRSCM